MKLLVIFLCASVCALQASLANYAIKGDHWSPSGLPDDFFDHVIEEWGEMVSRHDVDNMVTKYTENAAVIYEDRVLYGRLAIRENYRDWFNATNVSRIKVTLLDGGLLGDDYTFMINEHCYYDPDDEPIGGFKALVIFSHVKGGFQTHLQAMMDHGEKKCGTEPKAKAGVSSRMYHDQY